jgi:membrane-associated phospholipid phosphatase
MKLSKKRKKEIQRVLLEIPSLVFSSVIVTTVATIILARYLPYLGLIFSSILFYVFMPVLTYAYLYKRGLITDKKFDFNIRKREERPLYTLIVIMGFLTNYILISLYNIPIVEEVSLFLFLAFFVFSIVTLFWKISGHMTQTVLSVLILAYVFPNLSIPILLIGYLICVPLVGLSRVKLGHHTIWQIIAGTLVTSSIGIILFTIL